MPVKAIRLGGGGARGPLWRQIQADVYGQPVELLEAEEGGAFGAALLAGTGIGVWAERGGGLCGYGAGGGDDCAEGCAAVMDEGYAGYRRIYPALKTIAGREIS